MKKSKYDNQCPQLLIPKPLNEKTASVDFFRAKIQSMSFDKKYITTTQKDSHILSHTKKQILSHTNIQANDNKKREEIISRQTTVSPDGTKVVIEDIKAEESQQTKTTEIVDEEITVEKLTEIRNHMESEIRTHAQSLVCELDQHILLLQNKDNMGCNYLQTTISEVLNVSPVIRERLSRPYYQFMDFHKFKFNMIPKDTERANCHDMDMFFVNRIIPNICSRKEILHFKRITESNYITLKSKSLQKKQFVRDYFSHPARKSLKKTVMMSFVTEKGITNDWPETGPCISLSKLLCWKLLSEHGPFPKTHTNVLPILLFVGEKYNVYEKPTLQLDITNSDKINSDTTQNNQDETKYEQNEDENENDDFDDEEDPEIKAHKSLLLSRSSRNMYYLNELDRNPIKNIDGKRCLVVIDCTFLFDPDQGKRPEDGLNLPCVKITITLPLKILLSIPQYNKFVRESLVSNIQSDMKENINEINDELDINQ